MKNMVRIIFILLGFSFFPFISAYSQVTGNFSTGGSRNALLPDKCYLKYIYEFPFESKPIFYSERFPDLETRSYLNSDLIDPLFNRILNDGYPVSDPNWWGSIKELINSGKLPAIDTVRILKYLHAGWDTTFSIDENSMISLLPVYNDPDLSKISGLFFFESWFLDKRKGFLNKEVVAYMPIYEYWDESALERGEQTKLKRLVFLVYQGEQDPKKQKNVMTDPEHAGFMLLYKGVKSELNLYNRPYSFYLHRDQDVTTEDQYNEWEYHTFDFYKDFNTGRFLEAIISMTLEGRFLAEDPANPGDIIPAKELHNMISNARKTKIIYDDMNSVVFNEDWYFNPETLSILKKVNSITILKHDYQFDEYTGDFLRVVKSPIIIVRQK